METIGLLVTLEACAGKEADAEAFLKSARPLAMDESGTLKWYDRLAQENSASSTPSQRSRPQRPPDRRNRQEANSPRQRTIRRPSAGRKKS